jgi:hypothetical protein
MTEFRDIDFRSKAFRGGNLKRTFDFAVRGLPRHILRGEQFVDPDWAFGIYEREIRQLDDFNIHPKWFSSGVLGAALISLKLCPQTLELWRRFAQHEVYRDEIGSDAPGFLRDLVERHQNDRRLTRSQYYQMFLFQATLAMARAWTHHGNPDLRYQFLPPVPDAAELIAEVRTLCNERHSLTGFRPPRVTRDHWVELQMPQVVHEPDYEQVLQLAQRAATLEDTPPSADALEEALAWVAQPHPPLEFRHPALLAATVVTIAQAAESRDLWNRVFGFLGCRKPNNGRKPYSDISACLIDCIRLANRSNEPERAATALYDRARVLVDLWLEEPDQWRVALPRAPKERPLNELWADLHVNFSPQIIFECERPGLMLTPDEDESGGEGGNGAASRKKPDPDTARKRLETGETAEQWFVNNYQSVCPEFRGVPLVDCRERRSGYDFKLKPKQEGPWRVELKSLSKGGAVSLTNRQWERAQLEGENYFLIIIRGIQSDRPGALVIRNPFAKLKPKRQKPVQSVSWRVESDDLEEAADNSEEE